MGNKSQRPGRPDGSFPEGIKLWHDCVDAKVDICFVHGMTGDRDGTWTADGQIDPWPKVLLPPELSNARLLTFGYDAYVIKKAQPSVNGLQDHANSLIVALAMDRAKAKANGRPLIFVAHSLGGLVCKEAILTSRHNVEQHLRDVFDSFKGIVFMGTPHEGSWRADWARIPVRTLSPFKSMNRTLLDLLQDGNKLLELSQTRFWSMMRELRESGHQVEATCFYEELGMPVAGIIVSKASATVESYQAISIHSDHSGMVKFASKEDSGFQKVHWELERWTSGIRNQIKLDEKQLKFLKIFSTIDPDLEMKGILQKKGGLFKGSCDWILKQVEAWRTVEKHQTLWIHGEPGKGKTMLFCGIIDMLKQQQIKRPVTVSYFFCVGTSIRLNNATAVMRGLIYLLLENQTHLIPKLHEKYKTKNDDLLKDVDAWVALSELMDNILKDQALDPAIIVIDGLDECDTGREQLLTFFVTRASKYPRVKWILSSRPWPRIRAHLGQIANLTELSLEDDNNAANIRASVETYIDDKVKELVSFHDYDKKTEKEVRDRLVDNADGTFLWVALACQELHDTSPLRTTAALEALPSKLKDLYQIMLERVLASDIKDFCVPVLSVMAHVYEPLGFNEMISLVEILADKSEKDVVNIIRSCGSFLVERGQIVSFVHQSAKEFLLKSELVQHTDFDDSTALHQSILVNALQLMGGKLNYNMHGITLPNTSIDEIVKPNDDILAGMRYSCRHWMKHAYDMASPNPGLYVKSMDDIYEFLKRHFLHWIESLSLLRVMAEGILDIKMLLEILPSRCQELRLFLQDADKFVVKNRGIMERAPLQIYGSALLFSPRLSKVWTCFSDSRLQFVKGIQGVQEAANPCLHMLEGHTGYVLAAVLSPDDQLLASTSTNGTMRIWQTLTGACIQRVQIESEHKSTYVLAFSPKSDLVACAWDHHDAPIKLAIFSPNGKQIVSASKDCTARIWDISNGNYVILRGHKSYITSLAFTPDNETLATGSEDSTIRLWNPVQGTFIKTIDVGQHANQLIFTSNETISSILGDGKTIKEWNIKTGVCMRDWSHRRRVRARSANGQILATEVRHNTLGLVKIGGKGDEGDFDKEPYCILPDGGSILSFSASGKFIISCSYGSSIIYIWNTNLQYLDPRTDDDFRQLLFSPDGSMLATASITWGPPASKIIIWDTKTRNIPEVLCKISSDDLGDLSMAFSPNGRRFALLTCFSGKVFVWSIEKQLQVPEVPVAQIIRFTLDAQLQVPEVPKEQIIRFTPDGKHVAIYNEVSTQIWNIAEGKCIKSIEVTDMVHEATMVPISGFQSNIYGPPRKDYDPIFPLSVDSDLRDHRGSESLYAIPKSFYPCSEWVIRRDQEVLWLPPDCRPHCTASHGDLLAISAQNKQIIWIEFSPEAPSCG
ncbi:hypothetical protein Hte_011516 [Hypoxylon texense]